MENPLLITPEINKNNSNFEFKLEIETKSNNNYLYSIFFSSEDNSYINIKAINKVNNMRTIFSNKLSKKIIKKNKFNSLKEICRKLKEIISKDTIQLIEKEKLLIIIIPLPNSKVKEIISDLKEEEINEKEEIKNINQILFELKNEVNEIKKENIELKNIIKEQKIEKHKDQNYLKDIENLIYLI